MGHSCAGDAVGVRQIRFYVENGSAVDESLVNQQRTLYEPRIGRPRPRKSEIIVAIIAESSDDGPHGGPCVSPEGCVSKSAR